MASEPVRRAALPLKRGIFEDLLAAHPEAIDRDQLKLALSQHTRSSRYLTVVASGQARHDLQGQSVEPMAPEHVHHALIEVFRRRQHRSPEDLAPKLRNRIIAAYEASGLSRDDYAARVQAVTRPPTPWWPRPWPKPMRVLHETKLCCAPSRPAARPPKPALPTCTA